MNQTNPQPAEEELSSTRVDSPDIIEIDPALVQIKADSLEVRFPEYIMMLNDFL